MSSIYIHNYNIMSKSKFIIAIGQHLPYYITLQNDHSLRPAHQQL